MKKPDKSQKATAAKPKARDKVSGALTGPGLLAPADLDAVAGGNTGGTGRACAGAATTLRC